MLAVFAVLALLVSTSPVSLAAAPAAGQRAAVDAPAVPGQFIVKWRSGTPADARAAVLQAEGGRRFDRIADLDADAVEFPALTGRANPTAADALISRLKRNPNVEYVEPN